LRLDIIQRLSTALNIFGQWTLRSRSVAYVKNALKRRRYYSSMTWLTTTLRPVDRQRRTAYNKCVVRRYYCFRRRLTAECFRPRLFVCIE